MSTVHRYQGSDTCKEHGPYVYEARRVGACVLGNICPVCLAATQARSLDLNQAAQSKREASDRRAQLLGAGIPEAFLEATLTSYVPTNDAADKALLVSKNFAGKFGAVLRGRPVSGMLFMGVPGSGKTHLGCGIVAHLLQSGFSGAYMSCPQFLLAAKESQSFRSEMPTSRLIERYVRPQFLVIDEFGTHTTQDVDYQMLFAVIDGRYQRNLPTMLVTNMPEDQLKKAADTRLMERIKGINGPTLSFDWPTHRRPNASVRA